MKDQCCNSVPGLTGIPGEKDLVYDYWLAKPGTITKNNSLYIVNFLQDPEHCQMPDLFGFFGNCNVELTLLY